MPLAYLQCFCNERLILDAPGCAFSNGGPLPARNQYIAKCPCGRNWLISYAAHNPNFRPGRALCGGGAGVPAGTPLTPSPLAGEGGGEGEP